MEFLRKWSVGAFRMVEIPKFSGDSATKPPQRGLTVAPTDSLAISHIAYSSAKEMCS